MEKLFNLDYGIAGICVILTIQLLVKLGEFLWHLQMKKETLSEAAIKKLTQAVEENTFAAKHLDMRINSLEKALGDLPKFKTDIRRFYTAVKSLAGDKWPAIKKEILEDDIAT